MEPDNKSPSLIQFYEFTTLQIAREQTLINNRTTWQNAFQGFLFTAFVLGLEKVQQDYQWIVTIAIPLLGLWTCIATWSGINAAYQAIDQIKEKWNDRSRSFDHLFPPAFSDEKTSNWGRLTSYGILFGCIVAWFFILMKFIAT